MKSENGKRPRKELERKNILKQLMDKVVLAGLSVLCAYGVVYAEEDTGYFLSFKQKGTLIWNGRMEDSSGLWYNVRIVPGYQPPASYGWKSIKKSGHDLHEYIESDKYKSVSDHSGDCFEWAFADCLYDFALKGSGKAWGKYFKRAEKRVNKRVFGWWLSYPWALLQSTVDNVVRIPVGLLGAIGGTAAGVVAVPGYHLVDSGVKAGWHGGVEGLLVPVVGWGWNTIASPPLALIGQKPSEARVDDFWVRIVGEKEVHPPSLGADSFDAVAKCGIVFEKKLSPYREQCKKITAKERKEISKLRKEIQEIYKQAQKDRLKITEEEKREVQEILSDAQYSEIVAVINQGHWTRRRVQEYQSDISKSLKREGLTNDEVRSIMNLLKRYPPATINKAAASYMDEKTDPVTESIRVIKEID